MTFDTFEPDLTRLLYPDTAQQAGFKPYYVYKWERPGLASVIRHYPPATKSYTNYHAPSQAPSAIGFRGLMVADYDTPMAEQPLIRLAWVGLDIDYDDNKHIKLELGSLADYVNASLSSEPVVVRTSKSGKGAHVMVPIAEIELMHYERAKAVARKITARFVDHLLTDAVQCCVTGLPNLWLYTQGGAQRTVSMAADLYHPTAEELAAQGAGPASPGPLGSPTDRDSPIVFDGLAARVVAELIRDKVLHPNPVAGKTQCNIGRVKRSLEKISVYLDTRSKCRVEHEHEPNGYVEVTQDGTVRVFSNADDNRIILTLMSI